MLRQQFQAFRRGLVIGFVFACLAVWLLRDDLPASVLVGAVIVFALLSVARAGNAAAFARANPPVDALGRWRVSLVVGQALAGLWWGLLGAAAIANAPSNHALAAFALFAILASFQGASPVTYLPAFFAYVALAVVPMVAAAAYESDTMVRFLIPLGVVFLFAVTLAGRHTGDFMIDAIVKRHENLGLLQDLTARTDELDKAIRAKTHFLASASHDLRQPMQAIVLLVESLQERVHEPDTRRIVSSIRTSVTTMAALLNAILDISKFDAGTVRPERAHFSIGPMLGRLESTFSQEAARKDLALRVRHASAVIETDPVLLYRILANIVTNAVRYTVKGRVLVACRRRGTALAIEVWDTGPGIPQGEIEAIFREFYQLGNPQRDREQGLGLGLAIVERTAKLLGHPLTVRSRVGSGSVFRLLVPLGDPARVTAPRDEPGLRSALDGCRVLVVDDEAEIRAAITILLEGWGCTVHAVGSGAEASAHVLREGAPDVIVADYRLPGENGIEVIRNIARTHPGIGSILTSGDIGAEVLKEAERSGYTLLHKPLRPARLRALLGNLWRERSGKEREEKEPA